MTSASSAFSVAKPGRLYVPLDVNFFDENAKLSIPAKNLFIEMLCRAKRFMTDGTLDSAQISRCEAYSPEAFEALLSQGLIEAENEANLFCFPSWTHWNGEAKGIAERSRMKQTAGRKGGLISGLVRRGEAPRKSASSKLEALASTLLEPRDRVETEKSKELKASSPSVTPVEPLRGFEQFWTAYPKRNGKRLGRGLAEERWKKLSLEERREAYRGALNYAQACDSADQIAKDAERWLRLRCWPEWQEPAAPTPRRNGSGSHPTYAPLRLPTDEL